VLGRTLQAALCAPQPQDGSSGGAALALSGKQTWIIARHPLEPEPAHLPAGEPAQARKHDQREGDQAADRVAGQAEHLSPTELVPYHFVQLAKQMVSQAGATCLNRH